VHARAVEVDQVSIQGEVENCLEPVRQAVRTLAGMVPE
jgi:hypothetical protein